MNQETKTFPPQEKYKLIGKLIEEIKLRKKFVSDWKIVLGKKFDKRI